MTVVPPGYQAYGWWQSTSLQAPVRESAIHLVEEGKPYGPTLCGRTRGRRTRPDRGGDAALDLERGARKPCATCWGKAS